MIDTPLEPVFEFEGVSQRGEFTFAKVHLSIAAEDENLGHFNADLTFPVRLDQAMRYEDIREWALNLAKNAVLVKVVLPCLRRGSTPS